MKGLNLANSSTKNERKESDFYPTPPDVTQALIDTGVIPKGLILEPACGDGHMAEVFKRNGYRVLSTDIRETKYAEQVVDFLNFHSAPYDTQGETQAIVTNPPFNVSSEFIAHALGFDVPVVAMLLKSQYWHSQKRAALFEKYPPAYVMALTWRPDFCFGDRGGAPTMECIWTVWVEGETDTRYRVLRKPSVSGALNL
jgi:hypothetical protein